MGTYLASLGTNDKIANIVPQMTNVAELDVHIDETLFFPSGFLVVVDLLFAPN